MSNATLEAIKARKLRHALRLAGRIVSEGEARARARESAESARLGASSDRKPR